jgi:hypothetical protein
MATTKRQHTTNKPAAGRPSNTAGQPTISVRAERTAESLAAERKAMTIGRAKVAGAVTLPIILIAGLLLFFRPFARPSAGDLTQAPATAAPAAQALPTAAPALAAQPTAAAAPAVMPTAVAPAIQPLPTAAPAAAAPAAAAPAASAITCDAIAGLPLYAGATCIDRDLDNDDGVVKAKNSYSTPATADEVRRFYEGAFASGGWTLQEFSYEVNLGARRLNVQVEAEQGASGSFTKVKLTERGAPAGARTTCSAIEGLPAYPGAVCSAFDAEQDDGVLKVENSYTTSASPEEIRSFYADAFAKNSWAGQDFAYQVAQGLRRLQVDIEIQSGAGVPSTEIKIADK